MISLEKFIEKTKGTKVDVPWFHLGSGLKGQCVSLIQCYIKECLGQPAKARGDAKDWKITYVNQGLGKIVPTPRKGDILVFDNGKLGHIAIYISPGKMYDQNNLDHDGGKAGYANIFTKTPYIVLRPNADLIVDSSSVQKEDFTKGNYKTLCEMNVRKGAGTLYGVKKVKELTLDGRRNATSTNLNSKAVYKKNTIFTVQEIIINSNGSIWGKSPSGYICLKDKKQVYCKKI